MADVQKLWHGLRAFERRSKMEVTGLSGKNRHVTEMHGIGGGIVGWAKSQIQIRSEKKESKEPNVCLVCPQCSE